jgi:hypothetical protein
MRSSPSLVYTPNPGFPSTGGIETDVFRYRIVDSLGAVDSALVTVTLQLNRPPQAAADNASTRINQPVVIRVRSSCPDGYNGSLLLVPYASLSPGPAIVAARLAGAQPREHGDDGGPSAHPRVSRDPATSRTAAAAAP